MKHSPPIRVLFDYEWRLLRRDPGFWALMLLFAGCLVFAVWNGARWSNALSASVEEVREEEAERYADLENQFEDARQADRPPNYASDIRNPDTFGRTLGVRNAVMPMAPLGGLAIGQSDLYPAFYVISLEDLETVLAATEIENPHQLFIGRFDAAFIFLYLWPLLILALTYNLVSAERERGTLALILSQPMNPRVWLRARTSLRFGILFAPAVGLGLAAPLLFPGEGSAAGAWGRSLYWTILLLAYGLFWAALAGVVAWRGRSSARNALTLAFLWLILVVVAPSGTNLLLQSIFPMPSRMEYVGAMRDALDDARRESEQALGKYMQDHPDMVEGLSDRELANFAAQRLMVESSVREALRPVEARYEEQAVRQRRWVERLRYLSPAILLQDGLGDAAGVGMERHRHFRRQVREFYAQWQGLLHPLVLRQEVIRSVEDVPEFHFVEEPGTERALRGSGHLLGMLLPAAVLVVVAGRGRGTAIDREEG